MGLVNTVVPLDELEDETVQWCREMLALSPFALRLLKASFNAARGRLRRHPAARPRHQPPLLRHRGGPGGPRGLQGEARARLLAVPAPPVSLSRVRIWLMAARPRTLPAAVAPVLVGTALAPPSGDFARRRVRRRAARRDLHPGRDEPLQRLLRRAPRRRHRGPPRPGPRDRRRPRPAAPGARRDLRVVRAGGALRRLPRRSVAGLSPAAHRRASILAGVLYTGGPRPYGYEGLGEVFVFVFFGLVAVTGSYYVQAEQVTWEAFVLAVPVGLLATAILVVNNVRDLETDRRAGKRTLAVRLGRDARPHSLRAHGLRRLPHRAAALAARRALSAWLLLPLAARCRSRSRSCAPSANHTDGPTLNGALARTGHAPARCSACCCAPGCCASCMDGPRRPRVTADLRRGAAHGLRRRCSARELLLLRIRDGDGVVGRGEAGAAGALRRRGSTARSARRSRPTADPARRRRHARAARCSTRCRAVDRPPPGARRGRPRAVGPRRAAARAGRSPSCSATTPSGAVPVNATIGADRPRAAPPRRRRSAAARATRA